MSKPRAKHNPIQVAIQKWIATTSLAGTENHNRVDDLLSSAPKRYTIYEPMVLLPSGSFTSAVWTATLNTLDQETKNVIWGLILESLSKQAKGTLTHLAINEGIPLHQEGVEEENILRSPSGLRILYGDFGPHEVLGGVSEENFKAAFWVSTKQNGIFQTWAPRWTMFSRGNVKEKARVLDMEAARGVYAVDLYAGIGYFVFSYAKLGMRVLCWEINPWSVEGLRRGAEANKWSVKVVQGRDLELPTEELLDGEEQILVFLESNEEALQRIRALQSSGKAQNIQHVNAGFLPTSEPTWKPAWEMTALSSESWLHLHENVGVNDTETRKEEIQRLFESWKADNKRIVNVEHIELVKTFAPGVWHCVFDVHITRSTDP